MILHYLKIGFRNFRKYKVQNTIGIIGVAIGLSCFTLCCYIPRFLTSLDSSYPGADRIYSINPISGKLGLMLQKDFPDAIEKATMYSPVLNRDLQFRFNQGETVEYEAKLQEADTTLIDFFSLKYVAGNPYNTTHIPNNIVLFESFAKKIGNSKFLIGKEVLMRGKTFSISGILRDLPKTSSLTYDDNNGFIFEEDGFVKKEKETSFEENNLRSLVLLKKEIDPLKLEKRIKPIDYFGEKTSVKISQYSPFENHEITTKMYIILLIGITVLLTSLFNYISFLMSQFYNRLGECAIRRVNGSSRREIFGLFFTEFLIGWLLAGFISYFFLNVLTQYYELNKILWIVRTDLHLLQRHLAEYILIGILGVALLSIIPTLSIEKWSIKTTLLGITKRGNKSRIRNAFLFIQMAVLLGFLSSTLLIYKQLNKSYDGIYTSLTPQEKKNIFVCNCNKESLRDKKSILVQKIQASPFISQVTTIDSNPFYTFHSDQKEYFSIPFGREKLPFQVTMFSGVSSTFADFFNIKLKSGTFSKENSNVAVVDERIASLYPGKDPVGKEICFHRQKYTITGVTQYASFKKERKLKNIGTQQFAFFYIPDKTVFDRGEYLVYIKPVAGRQKEAREHIEKCIREFVPETIGFDVETLDLIINKQEFEEETVLLKAGGLFAFISLTICILSLYSSVSMNTERRRKEVAIRKINGAGMKEIIRLLAQKYVLLLTGAALIMFPVVYLAINRWLEQFVQRITLHWTFFFGVYLFTLLLVVLTILVQILRVAKENPAEVVKKE